MLKMWEMKDNITAELRNIMVVRLETGLDLYTGSSKKMDGI
jgi:hypothetical protein